ncbi:glycoside hydrolase family 2 TIM barrel-domain containing protein [Catenibacillus scindens]|uniref:glycoside hydrolase family 2 protein n=1 Tax=Catenibacillus scindens TaxID=673271 RepID=UPI00320B081D
MRRIYINDGWIFFPLWTPECIRTLCGFAGRKVRIPHVDEEWAGQGRENGCGYIYMLTVPESFSGRQLWLTFEGVGPTAWVFVNGSLAGHHCGWDRAFSLDISPYIHFGSENRIAIKLESGGEDRVLEKMAPGIYRSVYIEVRNPVHIEDIFIRTKIPEKSWEMGRGGRARLSVSYMLPPVAIKAFSGKYRDHLGYDYSGGYLETCVFDREDNCLGTALCDLSKFSPAEGKNWTVTVRMAFEHVHYWDLDQPELYYMESLLWDDSGHILDSRRSCFGFRNVSFRQDGFYLNGRKVKIFGLNRHQRYPYIGYGLPPALEQADADILKNELAVNAVRTPDGVPSEAFVNRCDEIGLMVVIPKAELTQVIQRYRNHPSVILWETDSDGVDDVRRAGQLIRRMDPTRQMSSATGYSDVCGRADYTFEGYGPGLRAPKKIPEAAGHPYVVTEHSGHMYPVQTRDCEPVRLEQALYHGHVLEGAFSKDEICGSFGWCMCDEIGDGGLRGEDTVCGSGVMDPFRNPKLSAWLYASQGEYHVAQIASGMSLRDYPGGLPSKIWLFTNCDFVEVYKNGADLGAFYPDRERFRHLPHPPVAVDARQIYNDMGDIRKADQTLRFDFIKNGQPVDSLVEKNGKKARLRIQCSHRTLTERHGYTMALLRIWAVDDQEIHMPWVNLPLRIKVRGPAQLVGPEMVLMSGGFAGALIRSLGGEGLVKVTVFSENMEPAQIYLRTRKDDHL